MSKQNKTCHKRVAPGTWPYRPSLGQLTVVSIYLKVGVGLDHTNLALLGQAAACADFLAHPNIIGGDMNSGPSVIKTSGLLERMGSQVAAPISMI